ncbi:carbonic anhydrase 1-like [Dermacentor andersoni]|uniref:carbonic anhydrase 1-like n=1 Tax=Dermacentor andersoni TaxID=34620 RepID=UPI003B3A9D83
MWVFNRAASRNVTRSIPGALCHQRRGLPACPALVTTWFVCACMPGTAEGVGLYRRLAVHRSLADIIPVAGWREYCDGGRWAYKSPYCGNVTNMDPNFSENQDAWPHFEKACGSAGQSPINIDFLQTSFKSFGPIAFLGYNVPFRFKVENGGHALYITPEKPHLESYGGPLPARYTLSKAVFRFGNETSERGSEHTLDGRNFAAELQLLMSCEKPTPTDCLRRDKGLAIFVILFEKRDVSNPPLDILVNATEHMTARGNTTETFIPMAVLLPNSTANYYLYLGSLTFPPCTGKALVVVFNSAVSIGETQLKKLRNNLYYYFGTCKNRVAGNLRKPQKLGNRIVYRSFKFTGAATTSRAALKVLIGVAAATTAHSIGSGRTI